MLKFIREYTLLNSVTRLAAAGDSFIAINTGVNVGNPTNVYSSGVVTGPTTPALAYSFVTGVRADDTAAGGALRLSHLTSFSQEHYEGGYTGVQAHTTQGGLAYVQHGQNLTDCIFGFSFKVNKTSHAQLLCVLANTDNSPILDIALNASGQLQVARATSTWSNYFKQGLVGVSTDYGQPLSSNNNYSAVAAYRTVLGTFAGSGIAVDTWYDLAVEFTRHASVGVVKVKLNGREILALTGVNTAGQGTAFNRLMLTNGFVAAPDVGDLRTHMGHTTYDNIWIWDKTGTFNNNWNDVKRFRLQPLVLSGTAVDSGTTLVGAADTQTALSSDDADTSYLVQPNGLTHTQNTQDLASGKAVSGLLLTAIAKQTGTTQRLSLIVREGATNYTVNTPVTLPTSYGLYQQLVAADPVDSSAWDEAKINSKSYGVIAANP